MLRLFFIFLVLCSGLRASTDDYSESLGVTEIWNALFRGEEIHELNFIDPNPFMFAKRLGMFVKFSKDYVKKRIEENLVNHGAESQIYWRLRNIMKSDVLGVHYVKNEDGMKFRLVEGYRWQDLPEIPFDIFGFAAFFGLRKTVKYILENFPEWILRDNMRIQRTNPFLLAIYGGQAKIVRDMILHTPAGYQYTLRVQDAHEHTPIVYCIKYDALEIFEVFLETGYLEWSEYAAGVEPSFVHIAGHYKAMRIFSYIRDRNPEFLLLEDATKNTAYHHLFRQRGLSQLYVRRTPPLSSDYISGKRNMFHQTEEDVFHQGLGTVKIPGDPETVKLDLDLKKLDETLISVILMESENLPIAPVFLMVLFNDWAPYIRFIKRRPSLFRFCSLQGNVFHGVVKYDDARARYLLKFKLLLRFAGKTYSSMWHTEQDTSSFTVLEYVIKHNMFAYLKSMFETGWIDESHRNLKGLTPLMIAIKHRRYEIIDYLLSIGDYTDPKNFILYDQSITYLDYALLADLDYPYLVKLASLCYECFAIRNFFYPPVKETASRDLYKLYRAAMMNPKYQEVVVDLHNHGSLMSLFRDGIANVTSWDFSYKLTKSKKLKSTKDLWNELHGEMFLTESLAEVDFASRVIFADTAEELIDEMELLKVKANEVKKEVNEIMERESSGSESSGLDTSGSSIVTENVCDKNGCEDNGSVSPSSSIASTVNDEDDLVRYSILKGFWSPDSDDEDDSHSRSSSKDPSEGTNPTIDDEETLVNSGDHSPVQMSPSSYDDTFADNHNGRNLPALEKKVITRHPADSYDTYWDEIRNCDDNPLETLDIKSPTKLCSVNWKFDNDKKGHPIIYFVNEQEKHKDPPSPIKKVVEPKQHQAPAPFRREIAFLNKLIHMPHQPVNPVQCPPKRLRYPYFAKQTDIDETVYVKVQKGIKAVLDDIVMSNIPNSVQALANLQQELSLELPLFIHFVWVKADHALDLDILPQFISTWLHHPTFLPQKNSFVSYLEKVEEFYAAKCSALKRDTLKPNVLKAAIQLLAV